MRLVYRIIRRRVCFYLGRSPAVHTWDEGIRRRDGLVEPVCRWCGTCGFSIPD